MITESFCIVLLLGLANGRAISNEKDSGERTYHLPDLIEDSPQHTLSSSLEEDEKLTNPRARRSLIVNHFINPNFEDDDSDMSFDEVEASLDHQNFGQRATLNENFDDIKSHHESSSDEVNHEDNNVELNPISVQELDAALMGTWSQLFSDLLNDPITPEKSAFDIDITEEVSSGPSKSDESKEVDSSHSDDEPLTTFNYSDMDRLEEKEKESTDETVFELGYPSPNSRETEYEKVDLSSNFPLENYLTQLYLSAYNRGLQDAKSLYPAEERSYYNYQQTPQKPSDVTIVVDNVQIKVSVAGSTPKMSPTFALANLMQQL